MSQAPKVPTAERWENEGGSVSGIPADEARIERVLVETFVVGGYTYSNRADAEAQARRMRGGKSIAL